MQSPPQAGEVWMNIHTSKKSTIHSVEQVVGSRGGFVVVYDDEQRCDIVNFNINWKRDRSASKWFLGALK